MLFLSLRCLFSELCSLSLSPQQSKLLSLITSLFSSQWWVFYGVGFGVGQVMVWVVQSGGVEVGRGKVMCGKVGHGDLGCGEVSHGLTAWILTRWVMDSQQM